MATTLQFTDAFTGTNGAGWSTSYWAANNVGGGAVNIQTNRGALTASASGSASKAYTFNHSARYADMLLTVTKAGVAGTGKVFLAPYADNPVASGGNFPFVDAVWAEFLNTTNTTVTLKAAKAGVVTSLNVTIPSWAVNTSRVIRLRYEPNGLYFRIWAVGGTEPGTWTGTLSLTGVGPTITTAQPAFVGHAQPAVTPTGTSAYIDDFTLNALTFDAGYTAEVITANADMPGGDVPHINASHVATPITASAMTPDALGMGNSRRVEIVDDVVSGAVYLKTPPPALLPGEIITSAAMWVTPSSTTNGYDLSRILSDWVESPFVTPTTEYLESRGQTLTFNVATAIDITAAVNAANYGVALSGVGLYQSENATPARRPYVIYTIGVPTAAGYSATPMAAAATMPNATVSTTKGVTYGAQAMSATAAFVEPVVTAQQFVSTTQAAEPLQAFADLGDSGFAVPNQVFAFAMTASATAVDIAGVGTTMGVAFAAAPMAASTQWVKPEAINGNPIVASEIEDTYFQRVNALFPDTWLRLNDAGSIAKDRVTGNNLGSYIGVQTNQFNGPESRHSVHFNGTAYIDTNEGGPLTDESTPAGGVALEFSFRTDKANAFLMIGQDSLINANATTPGSAKEVRLTDGKITLRSYRFGPGFTQTIDKEFSGFRNLNDGEWHSVVVRSTDPTGVDARSGVEIWIDGSFEIRRYGISGFAGFPDYIGGRPNYIEFGSDLPGLPGSEWFVGDMSEVVWYSQTSLGKEVIPRNFYAFMGWKPIEAAPIEAFAFTPANATGKGNQKRMLALYWSDEFDSYQRGGGNGKTNFDPLIAFTGGSTTYEGYKVFGQSVYRSASGFYRDPATDEASLINLETDLNLNDYDVITFQDWPDEGEELGAIDQSYPGQRERLIKQLRDANDKGIGLLIVQPRLAVDLGIIDRVEFVPTLAERKLSLAQGNAIGLYDYGSAVKFPWNIAGSSGMISTQYQGSIFNGLPMNTDPNFLAGKAFYYGDTNKNDRFRVRALIDGLTDIPSYMIQDAIFNVDYDGWGWQGAAYKDLHRLNGLQIGDEYIYHGSDLGLVGQWTDLFEYIVSRQLGTFATPPGNVKAGTVVTTFGAKHWVDKQEVDNPFKDYATTIVLQPGDSLGGRAVGGKIFVNFTEQPNFQPDGVIIQVLPSDNNDVQWPAQYRAPDTAAQREWEWSFTRNSLTSSSVSNTQAVTFIDTGGNTVTVNSAAGASDNLNMVRSHSLFPTVGAPHYQMVSRGLIWLLDRPEPEAAGAVTIRVEGLKATAAMPSPTVVAQRDAKVTATPMVALEHMPKVAEDATGEVEIRTLPLTASAQFTGFGKTISVQPMTATAELVENFNMVHATGEQVVLTLHGYDVTLYLKEEA